MLTIFYQPLFNRSNCFFIASFDEYKYANIAIRVKNEL
jgi:hypothetical protein